MDQHLVILVRKMLFCCFLMCCMNHLCIFNIKFALDARQCQQEQEIGSPYMQFNGRMACKTVLFPLFFFVIWIGCRLYGFAGGLTGTVSITTLTAISLDRYFVIIYPLNPGKLGSKKWRPLAMLCFVWLYSFSFAIMPALDIGLSRYTPEGFLTSCSFDYLDERVTARVFMFIFFICAWFVPLTIIVYCYAQIMKEVTATGKIQSNRMRSRIENKLTIVVVNVIALWFLAWTPYSIVALIGILGHKEYLTPWTSMIPALFCKASACINPYLYSMTHPQFKKEILRFFYTMFGIGNAMNFSSTKTLSVRFVSTKLARRTSNLELN